MNIVSEAIKNTFKCNFPIKRNGDMKKDVHSYLDWRDTAKIPDECPYNKNYER